MRKFLLAQVLLLSFSTMMAIPAHRGTVQVSQPDGSYITLCLLGDEWRSFNTTVDGYSVVKDSRGYYVYAQLDNGVLQPTSRVAHDVLERSSDEQAFLAGVKKYQTPQMDATLAAMKERMEIVGSQRRAQKRAGEYDYSKFKGLVVLIEFNDKAFSRSDYKEIITDMVNKQDYTGYDGLKLSGSVRDYFSDNSCGKFQPQFDVVGPYKVDFSQYDCNMSNGKCMEVLLAAIDSANVDVNFKDYDGDGDKCVDLVYFIVAGNGAHYTGNDKNLWWPHRSQLYKKSSQNWRVYKDNVQLYDYASSTELGGFTSQPKTIFIDGIGTICHEFSHVLGLPDFYDTDYEENGMSTTPGEWSLMDQGSYANNGYTPVGYSLFERYLVGFTGEPTKIEAEDSYSLNPLHTSNTGLRIDSPEKDEYFLFENRQKGDFKWDAYLPASGMLAYRVDVSNSEVWWSNNVNSNIKRNYYELLRAGGNENANSNYDVFPGRGKVTALHNGTEPANLKTWSGKASQWGLFDIGIVNGVVSFEIRDALTLKGLSLPSTAEVGVSVTLQLSAQLEPDYAVSTLLWTSSNKEIATVNADGVVTGVSEGSCDIVVKSDNGLSATCKLTVKSVPLYNIADFKALTVGVEELLQFNQAQVLFASGSTAFIRDASGAIMLVGFDGLKTNDVLNGVILVQVAKENMLPEALITNNSNVQGVKVTEGSQVEPRDVKLENLTASDYCDLVMVKAAKLVSKKVDGKSGVYLESGERYIRFFNSLKNLGISKTVTMPKNYLNKYYDVPALYATFVNGDTTQDAIYLMDSLTEVEDPTGIIEVSQENVRISQPVYNLHGQRVSPTTKGILIREGRKLLNR